MAWYVELVLCKHVDLSLNPQVPCKAEIGSLPATAVFLVCDGKCRKEILQKFLGFPVLSSQQQIDLLSNKVEGKDTYCCFLTSTCKDTSMCIHMHHT